MTSVPLTSKQCRFAQWSYLARYRVSGVQHTSKLAPNPAYPQIRNTLRAIVSSTS